MYFLKSDIDGFAPHRLSLDDEIKAGNVAFAYEVFDIFKTRLTTQLAKAISSSIRNTISPSMNR